MKSEIGLRVRTCVSSDFRKPRTGNHDAAGVHQTRLERLDGGSIYGMSHAQIVSMNDDKFRVARVSESFGDGF